MKRAFSLLSILGLMSVASCTVVPAGPMIMLPGPGKSQDAFRQDDAVCKSAIVAPDENDLAAQQAAEATYSQCMVARGNVLQPVPTAYSGGAYPYGYPAQWPYDGYSPYWGGGYGGAWIGGPIVIGGWGGYWGNNWHRWHHRPPPSGGGGGGGWGGGGGHWGGGPHVQGSGSGSRQTAPDRQR